MFCLRVLISTVARKKPMHIHPSASGHSAIQIQKISPQLHHDGSNVITTIFFFFKPWRTITSWLHVATCPKPTKESILCDCVHHKFRVRKYPNHGGWPGQEPLRFHGHGWNLSQMPFVAFQELMAHFSAHWLNTPFLLTFLLTSSRKHRAF